MNNFVAITFIWFGKFIFIHINIHMNIIRIQWIQYSIKRNTKFSAWNKENTFTCKLNLEKKLNIEFNEYNLKWLISIIIYNLLINLNN